jgi:hypothetical protein
VFLKGIEKGFGKEEGKRRRRRRRRRWGGERKNIPILCTAASAV